MLNQISDACATSLYSFLTSVLKVPTDEAFKSSGDKPPKILSFMLRTIAVRLLKTHPRPRQPFRNPISRTVLTSLSNQDIAIFEEMQMYHHQHT